MSYLDLLQTRRHHTGEVSSRKIYPIFILCIPFPDVALPLGTQIPSWAKGSALSIAVMEQYTHDKRLDPDTIFPQVFSCDLEAIFPVRSGVLTVQHLGNPRATEIASRVHLERISERPLEQM